MVILHRFYLLNLCIHTNNRIKCKKSPLKNSYLLKGLFRGDIMYISLDEAIMRIIKMLAEADMLSAESEFHIYQKIFSQSEVNWNDKEE